MSHEKINEKEIERVVLICQLATKEGITFSVRDLSKYLPCRFEVMELASFLNSSSFFNSRFTIHEGLIKPRERNEDGEAIKRALINVRIAEEFSKICGLKQVRVFGVSGSTSYLHASPEDDIDIFCITDRNCMWIYLTKALVFARLLRYLRKDYPVITLSCVMDEVYAYEEFRKIKDRLFAMDAVSLRLLRGMRFYAGLLQKSVWLGSIYPEKIKLKVSELMKSTEDSLIQRHSRSAILNSLLFFLVGTYIKIKSYLLNRNLSKTNYHMGIFKLKLGINCLIYESQFYMSLRKFYDQYDERRRLELAKDHS